MFAVPKELHALAVAQRLVFLRCQIWVSIRTSGSVFRFVVVLKSSSHSKVVDTWRPSLFAFRMVWKSWSVWTQTVLTDNILGFLQPFDQNSGRLPQIRTRTLIHTFLQTFYWIIIQLFDAVSHWQHEGQGEAVPVQAMEALIIYLDTRWKWMFRSNPRNLYRQAQHLRHRLKSKLDGPRSWRECFRQQNILISPPRIEPRFLGTTHRLVT
jgi:hypothetical protein